MDRLKRLLQLEKAGRLPHAMAFAGGSDEEKKSVALTLAAKLAGDLGILSIEPQKGMIKLEAAHQILQFLSLRLISPARVVLIFEAQTLNAQAANALLKVIEEPPEQTYFILLVNEMAQLLPTVRSRLQVFRFPLTRARVPVDNEASIMAREFILGSLSGKREALDILLDRGKDRETALNAILCMQHWLRDWSVDEVTEKWPERPVERRVALWRQSFQMEHDLHANVDRALIFQNFFIAGRA